MNEIIGTDKFLFGGDYNPEQWLNRPDILAQDIERLVEARVNVVSLGIFSWSTLEPSEGEFHFEWLREIMDRLHENGISTFLATPSGARPKWMADKYPEVLRVNKDRRRMLFSMRHNHCHTSKVYREKVAIINEKLARELGNHPGVILWHISNEYSGECYCETCQQAFREWLKDRYATIEKLNEEWVTAFWSHSYNSFDQIEAPGNMDFGEWAMNPLLLNWRRFVSYITKDFMKAEVAAIRKAGNTKPVTTNFMYDFDGLNYKDLSEVVDIVSWDNYSRWHRTDDIDIALDTAFQHDLMRGFLHKPFLLMESCPTAVNWQKVSKLRWPGLAETAGLQAIAHGSDSVMYFQMRQSRAGMEKLHGAVISSYGGRDDRIFRESVSLGKRLENLGCATGGEVPCQVGFVYDRENIWALEDSFGPRNKDIGIKSINSKMYKGLRKNNVNVEMLDMTDELEGFKLIVAPLAYMQRAGFAEKVRRYVENGGVFVTTYWFGIVDEDDKMHLGAVPHGLVDVIGLRETEIDALYDGTEYKILKSKDCQLNLKEEYTFDMLCNLIEPTTAKTLMTYGSDFYAGTPAVTENDFGKGKAYYIGAHAEDKFFLDIFDEILKTANVERIINGKVPESVEVSSRVMGDGTAVFLQNFSRDEVEVDISEYRGVLKAYETVVIS